MNSTFTEKLTWRNTSVEHCTAEALANIRLAMEMDPYAGRVYLQISPISISDFARGSKIEIRAWGVAKFHAGQIEAPLEAAKASQQPAKNPELVHQLGAWVAAELGMTAEYEDERHSGSMISYILIASAKS
jgi:hypothetical protein